MAKHMKGDIVTILMIIGGIFILLSVLVIGIFVFQSVRWGPCWANFGQEMGEIEQAFDKLKTQERAEETVAMGDCVGALVFTDEDGLKGIDTDDFRNALECPSGEGFIIGLPYFKDISWYRIDQKVVKAWEEMGRDIGPLCRSVDKEISASDDEINGPGEGKTRTICLELRKAGEGYSVSYEEGSCA